jgi:hypothetical protein
MSSDWFERKRRLHLNERPTLVGAILIGPIEAAEVVLSWTPTLPPNCARLRMAMLAEHNLRDALGSLMKHRSPLQRHACQLVKSLKAYIDRPDGVPLYPHLWRVPRGLLPWPNWQQRLDALQHERPYAAGGIDEDRRRLQRYEAFTALPEPSSYREPMPTDVLADLRKIARGPWQLTDDDKVEARRALGRLLIQSNWDHEDEQWAALDALAPPKPHPLANVAHVGTA